MRKTTSRASSVRPYRDGRGWLSERARAWGACVPGGRARSAFGLAIWFVVRVGAALAHDALLCDPTWCCDITYINIILRRSQALELRNTTVVCGPDPADADPADPPVWDAVENATAPRAWFGRCRPQRRRRREDFGSEGPPRAPAAADCIFSFCFPWFWIILIISYMLSFVSVDIIMCYNCYGL